MSAIGIKITAGLASTLALAGVVGGPIILGAALATGVALATWNLLADSWQLRLAKKIKKIFDDKDVISKLKTSIEDYWIDTEKSFLVGATSVEEAWQKYLEHQREITSPDINSRERIENLIQDLDKLRDFFGGIPWADIT